MKTVLGVSILGFILFMSLLPNLRAEVTMDEVRQEIQNQPQSVPPSPPADEAAPPDDEIEKIDFTSGNGIVIAKSSNGELRIAGYMLSRLTSRRSRS